jgi:hypothetical protein
MSIEQAVTEKLLQLPREKREEVLDFVEFLLDRLAGRRGADNGQGLWSDLEVDITDEDIAQARREMWGTFAEGDLE